MSTSQVLERILSSHNLYLTLGATFVFALVILWIALQRSRSILAVLWGLFPYLLAGLKTYASLVSIDCDPPEACEWSALGYILSLMIYASAAVLYLLVALRIRAIYRKAHASAPPEPRPVAAVLVESSQLLAGASLGLLGAILLAIFANSGVLVRWEFLEIPADIPANAGVPAEQIGIPAGQEVVQDILYGSQSSVIFETDLGRVLTVRFPPDDIPEEEQELAWVIETGRPISDQRAYEVGCPLRLMVPPPPGKVTDRIRSRFCDGYDLLQAEYALLEDGTLWAWREVVRLYQFLRLAVIAGPLVGVFIVLSWLIRKGGKIRTGGEGSREAEPGQPADAR